jgi:hypothetical protein
MWQAKKYDRNIRNIWYLLIHILLIISLNFLKLCQESRQINVWFKLSNNFAIQKKITPKS